MRMRHIFIYILPRSTIFFPHYLINGTIFEKKLLNTKCVFWFYEGHLESKERFAIKKYLLIIGEKKNMQVLSHTFTYFST